ncbi:MAG: sulfur oxidation c-type cytochrome SoxX [Hyphomicrobiaceae bacterium]
MLRVLAVACGLSASVAGGALGENGRAISERQIQRVMRQSFAGASPPWLQRLQPDATMAQCSTWHNKPPGNVADEIKAREYKSIRYPADRNFIGSWKRGEKLAQSGYGLRFTDDSAKRPNGGNCYACHQLSPQEVSFGTIGVSLKGYGKLHKTDTTAQIVYEKIYNSQSAVACSLMPRFGTNGILSIDDIRDLVAYLLDPESPVNK